MEGTRMLLDQTSMGDVTSTFEGRKYNRPRNLGDGGDSYVTERHVRAVTANMCHHNNFHEGQSSPVCGR
jgi:hypothetical protein